METEENPECELCGAYMLNPERHMEYHMELIEIIQNFIVSVRNNKGSIAGLLNIIKMRNDNTHVE